MSKAKDRTRAELGWIFRDGKLVRKEDYYAAHPTPEMLTEQRQTVKSAVKDEMAKKFSIPNRYYCTACRHYHVKSSKIGSEHTNFYLAEK